MIPKKLVTALAVLFLTISAFAQRLASQDSHQQAVDFLSALVKIDTSNPPGNEIKAAQYIKSLLDAEGIPSEIIGSAPGRTTVMGPATAFIGTVTWSVPPSIVVAVAVSKGEPHWTVEPGMKPLPLTVSVNPGLPAVAVLGTNGGAMFGVPAAIAPEPEPEPEP